MVHGFRNIDIILSISNEEIESYILIWRSPRLYGIHLWRHARELISRLRSGQIGWHIYVIYENDEEHIELVMQRLKEVGYYKIEEKHSII